MTLPITLSDDPNIAVYKRLAAALEKAFAQDILAPGAVMPSTRELSRSLGLSRATVVRAYEQLNRDGHLLAEAGGKTYVARQRGQVSSSSGSKKSLTAIHTFVSDDTAEFLSPYAKRLSDFSWSPNVAVQLNFGAPPRWSLPLSKWKYILNKTCSELDPSAMDYIRHPFGDIGVREVFSDYIKRRKGVQCDTSQTIAFADSESPLVYISRLLIEPGDVVVVEEPGHIGARDLFSTHGAEVLSVPIDDNGMQVQLLEEILQEQKVKFIYVTPSFQDPTGICMSLERRRRLVELAEKHNVLIVEDAWDGNSSYITPLLPSLFALSGSANVFYIYSFWKLLYPLSMVSCLIVPPQFVSIFFSAKMQSNGVSPVIEHHTLKIFIENGGLEAHFRSVQKKLVLRRQAMIAKLISIFGKDIRIKKQSAAFWLTAEFTGAISEESLIGRAKAEGVEIVSAASYYFNPEKVQSMAYLVPFVDFEI